MSEPIPVFCLNINPFNFLWGYVPLIFVMNFSPSNNSLCSPICLGICSFLFPSFYSTRAFHLAANERNREMEEGGRRSDSLREKDCPWSFGGGRWADVGRKHEEENRAYCSLQRRCGALTKSVQQLSAALPTFMLFSAGTIATQRSPFPMETHSCSKMLQTKVHF